MTGDELLFWILASPLIIFMNALAIAGAIAIIKEAWRL
jgi:hypothetical protein